MKKILEGIGASGGIAIGPAIVLWDTAKEDYPEVIPTGAEEEELARFAAARRQVRNELEKAREQAAKLGRTQVDVLTAHLLMLDDPALVGAVEDRIRQRISGERSVTQATEELAAIFTAMPDEYMRERAADIKDIGRRLLRTLMGGGPGGLPEDAEGIVVAVDLLPSDTAVLNPEKIKGFVTVQGGRTSHSAIIARNSGIPAVVGVGRDLLAVEAGMTVILDGTTGKAIVGPEPEVIEEYRGKIRLLKEQRERLLRIRDIPTRTADGVEVELAVNIGSPKDLSGVISVNADGIGLFRTEFLFMDRTELPTEEEQYEAYKKVLETLGGKKVIIRTLDAGGDKGLPYLNLPPEENPALGLRATRLCLMRKDIFKTQLRALLRAGLYGNLHIMFPMIAGLSDLREARSVLKEVRQELAAAGIPHQAEPIVGIMVEIPSAAVMADMLIKEVDFFSIGTNDLVQYTVAVDRMNEQVAGLSDYFHPAVLRLIGGVARAAVQQGKWVGMCGEMAGDPLATVLLVGLGLTELSMAGPSLLGVKDLLSRMRVNEAQFYAERALQLETAGEVRAYLQEVMARYEKPE